MRRTSERSHGADPNDVLVYESYPSEEQALTSFADAPTERRVLRRRPMAFIQVSEFQTDNLDKLHAVEDDWERATEGKRTVRRSILTRDRNDPGRFVNIVFFDSYESAMQNSNLPETGAAAEKLAAVMSSPPIYHDLDVVQDRTW